MARPKKWRKKGAKGSAFGIRLCARKRRGAAQPLCSCLRGDLKIQRLRLPLKAQRQTDRAKIFAISFCLKFVQTRVRSKHQKFLLSCLRASSVLVLGFPSANAKAEFAHLRATIRKIHDFSWRVAGFQRALGPLVPFLRLFFAARQRIGIRLYRAREAGRGSRSSRKKFR